MIATALAQTTDAVTDLVGASVFATDGEMGSLTDLEIDARSWTITHLLVQRSVDVTTQIALSDIRRQVDEARGGHVLVKGHCADYRLIEQ